MYPATTRKWNLVRFPNHFPLSCAIIVFGSRGDATQGSLQGWFSVSQEVIYDRQQWQAV